MFGYQKNGLGMGIKKRLVLSQTYYFLIRGIFLDSFLFQLKEFSLMLWGKESNPLFLLLTSLLPFMTKRIPHLFFRSLYKIPRLHVQEQQLHRVWLPISETLHSVQGFLATDTVSFDFLVPTQGLMSLLLKTSDIILHGRFKTQGKFFSQ